MKLFTFIFAVYLLLLTGIPCCAFDSCEDECEQTEQQQKDPGKGCSNCSPFFSCHGCIGGCIVPETFNVHTTMIIHHVRHSFIYRTVDLSGYIAAFWQPPRSS